MDKISIKNLEVYAYHGVYEEENRLGQKFVISVDMYLDTHPAAADDDLEKSVNYGEVCLRIRQLMEEKNCSLIETVAQRIASCILYSYKEVQKVCVEVAKPQAPIPMSIETVSVRIEREWHQVFVAFGSNMGDLKENIMAGISLLENEPDIRLIKCSDFYVTKPYGGVAQDDFLNGCLEIRTLESPEELLNTLNQIELKLGRERKVHWGPRTLDLDIIFYDDCVIDTHRLTVPHTDMANRLFVLEPLAQIGGYKRHPVLNRTVKELLNDLMNGKGGLDD